MKYMGSKSRYAKYLLPIILKDYQPGQWYIEPFVGGCNTIDKVEGKRAAIDTNFYLIEMWKALQNKWIPPENVNEDEYKEIRINKNKYPPCLVGYVGFNLSYAGKWWGGYARDGAGKRNYGNEAFRNVMKQISSIEDVVFEHGNYLDFDIIENSLIYCDPPYNGATGYKDNFNHSKFWNWCREKTKEGHKVFISEYVAPEDFECIWAKKVNNTLVQNTSAKQGVEKLFVYKGVV
jgi:DNA adenine methylase